MSPAVTELLIQGLKIERNNLAQAEELAEQALRLSRDGGDREGEARALRNQAYCLSAKGNTDAALAHLESALELATQASSPSACALCFHTQGFILHHLGRFAEALDAYEKAAQYRETLDEVELLAGTLNNIGTIWYHLGDYGSCLTAHQRALQLWRSKDNRLGEAITLHNLGNTYAAFEDPHSARTCYHEALSVVQEDHLLHFQWELGVTLARLERQQNALTAAHEALDRVAQVLQRIETPLAHAAYLEECGLLLRQQGHLQSARRPLAQSLRLYRKHPTPLAIPRVLHEVGQLYLQASRLPHACRSLLRSHRLAERYQLKPLLRDSANSLADAYERCGDTKTALAFHRLYHSIDRALFTESTQRLRLALLRQIELEKTLRENENLTRVNAHLQELATKDGMTGLNNHRAFHEHLKTILPRHPQTALLLIDVDHFKSYNDSFGHPAGDTLLRQLSEVLRTAVRDNDFLGRYGGEEFAVVLASTDLTTALEIAERIRAAVAQYPFPHRQVTVSIGVATSPAEASADTLIALADQALYAAKRGGRNKILRAA